MATITAKQIAKELGISTTAVSLALNGKPGVSNQTRAAVSDMAQKLGYKTPQSSGAGQLRSSTKALCFMIFAGQASQHTPFSTFVLEGVEKFAALEGYHILIRYVYADRILDPANLDLLSQVDGLILLGTDITQSDCPQVLSLLRSAGDIPKVVLDNPLLLEYADCICNDNYGGTSLAMAHLIEQGCSTLGYLCATQRVAAFEERERAIRDTLKKAGLPQAIAIPLGISFEDAQLDMTRWLETNPILPQGFFAENDVLAAAAIAALKSKGIAVPQQVSIVGFDDVPIAQMTQPQITSVKSHMEDLGVAAVNTIFLRMKMNAAGRRSQSYLQTYVSTTLKIRDSVRLPRCF